MKKLTLGKIMLITGGILGIVPLFFFVSFPVYLTGAILMIKSKLPKRNKIIWLITPLGIVFLIWLIVVLIEMYYR